MALIPDKGELSQLLDDAGGIRFVRYSHLIRNQGILELDWQGEKLRVQIGIFDVFEAGIPRNPHSRERDDLPPAALRARVRRLKGLSEEVLRVENLPLYLSESWLFGALKKWGSFVKMEEVYGYSNALLSRYAQRYGLSSKPRIRHKLREKARELLERGMSPVEVISQTGMSRSGVYRIHAHLKGEHNVSEPEL